MARPTYRPRVSDHYPGIPLGEARVAASLRKQVHHLQDGTHNAQIQLVVVPVRPCW